MRFEESKNLSHPNTSAWSMLFYSHDSRQNNYHLFFNALLVGKMAGNFKLDKIHFGNSYDWKKTCS